MFIYETVFACYISVDPGMAAQKITYRVGKFTCTSAFNKNKLRKSCNTVEIKFFYCFLVD
jgi:hypothetical protein